MNKKKVYRSRRKNMALPLLLALVLVALFSVVLVSCSLKKQPAPAPEPESAPSAEETGPEDRPASESEPEPEPEPEEPAAPVEQQESDGEEIALPQNMDTEKFGHLFPAGNDDYRLVLVNKDYTMPEEFPDLPLADIGDGYRVHAEMYDALVEMMEAAKAEGLPLYIISGYRPMERSRVLYENKVQEYLNAGYSEEDARAEAAMWVAPPGTSEHATGLAVDLISADYYTKLPDLLPEFEEFEEAQWMKEHCAEYGFILRFPKGKEDITKVVFEPWHFRYVGRQAAAAIMEAGITLEEYLGVA